MAQLQGHSITYRIAVGTHQGRKVFTLPARDLDDPDTVGKTAGFSLHSTMSSLRPFGKTLYASTIVA